MRRSPRVEKTISGSTSSPWWKYLNLTGKGFRSTTSERGLYPECSEEGGQNLTDQLSSSVNEAEHQQHGPKNLGRGLQAPGSPGTDLLAQKHPQIECTGLNQESFEDVRVPSDLGPPGHMQKLCTAGACAVAFAMSE